MGKRRDTCPDVRGAVRTVDLDGALLSGNQGGWCGMGDSRQDGSGATLAGVGGLAHVVRARGMGWSDSSRRLDRTGRNGTGRTTGRLRPERRLSTVWRLARVAPAENSPAVRLWAEAEGGRRRDRREALRLKVGGNISSKIVVTILEDSWTILEDSCNNPRG